MITINITEETATVQDMIYCLEEVVKRLNNGVKTSYAPDFTVSGEERKYYAILEQGDCILHSGRNTETPEEAAKAFLELKLTGLNKKETKEYKRLFDELSPEDFIFNFDSELLVQYEPFNEED